MSQSTAMFLPMSKRDMKQLQWDQCDIIFVTGDAYIDHPFNGVALLGKLLLAHGYKVGVIAQPDWKKNDDFTQLGAPRLFFAVTAGAMDFVVANYTPLLKEREDDASSPNGKVGMRPDRPTIVYTQTLRRNFSKIPIIIGGIEASLRRFAHFDYFQNKIRRSILLDAKADALVYGMGERQILEIAKRLKNGETLDNIRGICLVKKNTPKKAIILPSFEKVSSDKNDFAKSFVLQYENADWNKDSILAEANNNNSNFIVQYAPAFPLSTEELDFLYEQPFARKAHPYYGKKRIPSLEPVKFSVLTHRGCFGMCHFCAIGLHQGMSIQSRSQASILREIKQLTKHPDFKGYIDDVGGPSANMYGMFCSRKKNQRTVEVDSIINGEKRNISFSTLCPRPHCLPNQCKELYDDTTPLVTLLKKIRKIQGIKASFIRSGLRFDLAPNDISYWEEIICHHVSGRLKIAPEHISDTVLEAMNKGSHKEFLRFLSLFKRLSKKAKKKQFIQPYLIAAHPGTQLSHMRELKEFVDKKGLRANQTQLFTPTPMTVSTCMYHCGKNPFTGKKMLVSRNFAEKKKQKNVLLNDERKPLLRR